MARLSRKRILRWIAVLPAACLAAGVAGLASWYIVSFISGQSLGKWLFVRLVALLVGGWLFVSAGAWTAPGFRKRVAFGLLALSVILCCTTWIFAHGRYPQAAMLIIALLGAGWSTLSIVEDPRAGNWWDDFGPGSSLLWWVWPWW